MFRWLWRANAVAIFLVALAALFSMAWFMVDMMEDSRRRHAEAQAAPAIRPGDTNDPSASLRLGAPFPVTGTQVLRANLESVEGRTSGMSGSSDDTETRNVLFIDTATGAGRWLLPTHRRVIVSAETVYASDDPGSHGPPVGALVLVKDDEDAETGDLLVFNGPATTIVPLSGVRAYHSSTATEGNQLIVVFDRGGKYVLARFETPSMRKLSETEIRVPDLR